MSSWKGKCLERCESEIDEVIAEVVNLIRFEVGIDLRSISEGKIENAVKLNLRTRHPLIASIINIGNRSQDVRNWVGKDFSDLRNYVSSDEMHEIIRLSKLGKKSLSKNDKEKLEVLERKILDKAEYKLSNKLNEIKCKLKKRLCELWLDELKERRIIISADFTGVSYSEWPNSFVGELDSLKKDELGYLISSLILSIPLTPKIAIWFNSEELLRDLHSKLTVELSSDYYTSLKKILHVSNIDDGFPYVILLALLVFLGFNMTTFKDIVDKLVSTNYGYIFINMGRGDRRLYFIPKLDIFIKRWIAGPNNMLEELNNLISFLNKFVGVVKKEIKSKAEPLLSIMNIICYQLMERGFAASQLIRSFLDEVINQYDKINSSSKPNSTKRLQLLKPLKFLLKFLEAEHMNKPDEIKTNQSANESGDLYNWAFYVGKEIICRASEMFSADQARNYIMRVIKELRNERLPEKFRDKFSRLLTEVMENLSIPVAFPKVLKKGDKISLDEFYRISSLLIMGFWDAYAVFSNKKEVNKESFCSEKK